MESSVGQSTDARVSVGLHENPLKRLWDLMVAHPILTLVILGLVSRIIVAIGVYVVFGGILFGDDGTYHQLVELLVTGRQNVWSPRDFALYEAVRAFTFPLTAIYWAFGPNPLGGQFLAAIFGTLAAVFTYLWAHQVLPRAWSLVAGLIVALLPSQVLFSGLVLKDSEIWAVLTILALAITVVLRESSWHRAIRWAAVIPVGLLLLGYLRPHTLVIAVWSMVVAAIWGSRQRRVVHIVGALALAVLVPWVVGLGLGGSEFIVNKGRFVDEYRDFTAVGANTAVVPDYTATQAAPSPEVTAPSPEATAPSPKATPPSGGSDSSDGARPREPGARDAYSDQFLAHDMPSPDRTGRAYSDQFLAYEADNPPVVERTAGADDPLMDNVRHLPRGLVVALLEPLPWRSGNVRTDLARAETILWYPLLALGILGIPGLLRRPGLGVFAFVLSGGLVLAMALAEGNYGTSYRHRGEVVWAIAVAAVFGVQQLGRWTTRLRASRT